MGSGARAHNVRDSGIVDRNQGSVRTVNHSAASLLLRLAKRFDGRLHVAIRHDENVFRQPFGGQPAAPSCEAI